jgi:alpha-tubulin suppressor-like RCC1 family protein
MAVYSFGKGNLGQLGLGEFENSFRPKLIEALRGKNIASTSCGEQHSLAVTGDLLVAHF